MAATSARCRSPAAAGTGCGAGRVPARASARPRARRAGPRRARCCSTATGRWSSTSPTTATRSGSCRCRGARGARPAARAPACRIGRGHQPERHRPRAADRASRSRRSTRGSRSCSARSTRGCLPARARRRLRLPQAAPGLVLAAAARARRRARSAAWSIGDIGADVEAAAAAGARGVLVPDAAHAAEEIAARRRGRAATWRGAVEPRCSGGGAMTPRAGRPPGQRRRRAARRARPCARSPPAPTRVTLLCGPRGRAGRAAAAGRRRGRRLARAVDRPRARARSTARDVDALRRRRCAALGADRALILTSFHQCPLPLALLLRLAGVPRDRGDRVDYPGSLLDVRHRVDDDLHEVERALVAGRGAGLRAARRRRRPPARAAPPAGGAAPRTVRRRASRAPRCPRAPGRRSATRRWSRALAAAGRRVVVTGGPGERALTARVAGRRGRGQDLGGAHDARRAGRRARRRRRGRRRQHRPRAPGRRGRHAGGLAVRARRCRPCGGGPWRVPHVLLGRRRALRRLPGARLPGAGPPVPDDVERRRTCCAAVDAARAAPSRAVAA